MVGMLRSTLVARRADQKPGSILTALTGTLCSLAYGDFSSCRIPASAASSSGVAAANRNQRMEFSLLQNSEFVQQLAFGEAADVQHGRIDDLRATVQDEVGCDAAGSGRMHYPVAAEACG